MLNNLSGDVKNYPRNVMISEIGGYSFTKFTCIDGQMRISSSIDIGSDSMLGKQLGIQFFDAEDVISNYDTIKSVLASLSEPLGSYYSSDDHAETYIYFMKMKSDDKDPIYVLDGVDDKFTFAKTLKWKNADCSR